MTISHAILARSSFVVVCFSQFASRFRDRTDIKGITSRVSLEMAVGHKLTLSQEAFAVHLADGMAPTDAVLAAGYSDSDPDKEAWRLMQHPAILAIVQIRVARAFAIDSAVSAHLLRRFVTEEKWDPKVRLAAANSILNRAGHIAPKARDQAASAEKALNEMSMGELRTLADKLEGEIAGRAKEVSSAKPAPHDTQAIDDII